MNGASACSLGVRSGERVDRIRNLCEIKIGGSVSRRVGVRGGGVRRAEKCDCVCQLPPADHPASNIICSLSTTFITTRHHVGLATLLSPSLASLAPKQVPKEGTGELVHSRCVRAPTPPLPSPPHAPACPLAGHVHPHTHTPRTTTHTPTHAHTHTRPRTPTHTHAHAPTRPHTHTPPLAQGTTMTSTGKRDDGCACCWRRRTYRRRAAF